jgi:hypothetical protein
VIINLETINPLSASISRPTVDFLRSSLIS